MIEEYEVKFRVAGFDHLRETLSGLGAVHLGTDDEKNLLFDLPDGSLAARGVLLRLRDTGGRVLLTVKQRVPCRGVKARREYETPVEATLEEGVAMLSVLGYERTVGYEKRRDRWRLPSGVLACLDTLVFGRFLELEGTGPAEVAEAAELLGFPMDGAITEGYPDLMRNSEP